MEVNPRRKSECSSFSENNHKISVIFLILKISRLKPRKKFLPITMRFLIFYLFRKEILKFLHECPNTVIGDKSFSSELRVDFLSFSICASNDDLETAGSSTNGFTLYLRRGVFGLDCVLNNHILGVETSGTTVFDGN